MAEDHDFDAIVIGSGITGGWAAKELTEKGLRVLMIERGPPIEHQNYANEITPPWEMPFLGKGDAAEWKRDYAVQSQMKMFFNEWSQGHFVNDRLNPYQSDPDRPFDWIRGYQLGGRSLIWGRQCYRWSDLDFGANKADGHGTDWPIRYADVEKWYDYVEDFIGVSGSKEGLSQLPDGHFQPPMELNAAERVVKKAVEAKYPDRRVMIGRSSNITRAVGDRAPCQYRGICSRGCSYGAYFSTQSSTLPAARKTGRLTLLTDTAVTRLVHDPATGKIAAVETLGAKDRKPGRYTARLFFLNASTFNTIGLLLRSTSAAFPRGLANSSGVLGQYIMDHAQTSSAVARFPQLAGHTYFGNRPNNAVIPRFHNVGKQTADFVRGYSYQGGANRPGWRRGGRMAGVGEQLRETLHSPGDWTMVLGSFVECLPNAANRVTLHRDKVDALGMPQIAVSFAFGENEHKALLDAEKEARAMLEIAGGEIISTSHTPDRGGRAIHEMGGARMGRDPRTSVLNAHNQAHDVANLFITDGAAMASSACQNPSLTYMALTARACAHAVDMLKSERL